MIKIEGRIPRTGGLGEKGLEIEIIEHVGFLKNAKIHLTFDKNGIQHLSDRMGSLDKLIGKKVTIIIQ